MTGIFLVTDHVPLRWVRNLQDPSSQLALLQDNQYEILHRPGLKHSNEDAVSQIKIAWQVQPFERDESRYLNEIHTNEEEQAEFQPF